MEVVCVSDKDLAGTKHLNGDILRCAGQFLILYFRREKLPSTADQMVRRNLANDN